MKVHVNKLIRIFISILILGCWLWGSLAIYYAGPENKIVLYAILLLFITTLPLSFYLTRSFNKTVLTSIVVFSLLQIWWNTLSPSNDKDWAADTARIPYAEINADKLTMHNVRNFDYRSETDFTERWETRYYDLSKLKSVDLFLSYWGSPHIAHTIMSWGFENGDQLAVSIETRKDKTQEYSAIKGFFKQFTLAYVAADERDLIRLRTDYRKEDVYLYRFQNAPLSRARALLESYIKHMNHLKDKPAFYHALALNCTSAITLHTQAINPDSLPTDWRLIANGHLDELLYDFKRIRTDMPFSELRQLSHINQRAGNLQGKSFSQGIREGLLAEQKK